MVRKAKSLYEVFVSAGGGGERKEKPESPRRSRRRSARGRNNPGERRIEFSLSLNALMGLGLVLVVFLAGMFALGRYSNRGVQSALMGPRRFFCPLTLPGAERESLRTWLGENGLQGVAFQPDPQGQDHVQLLIPLPARGLKVLKERLVEMPAHPEWGRIFTRQKLELGKLVTLE